MKRVGTFRDTRTQDRGDSASPKKDENFDGNEYFLKASDGTYRGLWTHEESFVSQSKRNEKKHNER